MTDVDKMNEDVETQATIRDLRAENRKLQTEKMRLELRLNLMHNALDELIGAAGDRNDP